VALLGRAFFGAAGARFLLMLIAGCVCSPQSSPAQDNGSERTFPQSKVTVERALKEMQSATAGHLPVLAGFAVAGDHALDRYQRGFYQAKFQVSAAPSGGSIVRVSVEVTAWYADPAGTHSGYQALASNGRLESDLLDQLADQLSGKSARAGTGSAAVAAHKPFPSEQRATPGQGASKALASTQSGSAQSGSAQPDSQSSAPTQPDTGQAMRASAASEPAVSAPVPQLPDTGGKFSSSLAQSLAEPEKSQAGKKETLDEDPNLRAEAESLEEILKNQAHPANLVAVKKNGTPVVETASLTAKALFLASAHDEFEMLDFNRDWVHVRISGLSRGWIWRNSLEMPGSVPDSDAPPSPVPVAAELFHVTREETAVFPGDWAPLRGKSVRIVSVEKINDNDKGETGARLRLEFAKSVLDKDYAELAQKTQELAGIVVIFDAVDGGMIAATSLSLKLWKSGKLSDAALWHQCFFDPPETFNESGSSGSQ
jgi:hypothetical protein